MPIKNLLRHRTRYRGLAANMPQLFMVFDFPNLVLPRPPFTRSSTPVAP
jgi:hypothetical protein